MKLTNSEKTTQFLSRWVNLAASFLTGVSLICTSLFVIQQETTRRQTHTGTQTQTHTQSPKAPENKPQSLLIWTLHLVDNGIKPTAWNKTPTQHSFSLLNHWWKTHWHTHTSARVAFFLPCSLCRTIKSSSPPTGRLIKSLLSGTSGRSPADELRRDVIGRLVPLRDLFIPRTCHHLIGRLSWQINTHRSPSCRQQSGAPLLD